MEKKAEPWGQVGLKELTAGQFFLVVNRDGEENYSGQPYQSTWKRKREVNSSCETHFSSELQSTPPENLEDFRCVDSYPVGTPGHQIVLIYNLIRRPSAMLLHRDTPFTIHKNFLF
jgi:hypothetical protein